MTNRKSYLVENPRHTMVLKRPASWRGDMWRTALPAGNGLTGVLMHGAVAVESIQLNRHDLWYGGGRTGPLPDLSDTLGHMRAKILAEQYQEANGMLSAALSASGFREGLSSPYPLGMLQIQHPCVVPFTGYRRGILLDRGELFTHWQEGDTLCERRLFVSRADDVVYLRVTGNVRDTYTIAPLDLSHCPPHAVEEIRQNLHIRYDGNTMLYVSQLGNVNFGAVVRILGGKVTTCDHGLTVTGDHTLLLKTFRDTSPDESLALLTALPDTADLYNTQLTENDRLYGTLYHATSLTLTSEDEMSATNEELLDIAYDDKASPALLERLWRFGRYLFISGTHENGNPFPLYGLWHGDYGLMWAQHVANENVQMLYRHADTSGLSYAVRALLRYYTAMMPVFQENARMLFGCDGIYIPAYTAPGCGGSSVNVPVILNWISCAGWLSAHFCSYYRHTGDKETLLSDILPFLFQTARFYEGYLVYDEKGTAILCPSVSPENTPGNLMPPDGADKLSHPCPAVRDALMDHAILREVLTNLIDLSRETGLDQYTAKIPAWEKMLASLPPYTVNEDGAVREWLYDALDDNYAHRHLSHLYPVFPGNEVLPDADSAVLDSFRKAVSLREVDSQSGWSFPHMACIYARLGMGEEALQSIDLLTKGCLLDNLFTLHNDWRHMGASLEMTDAPVQLDALMGTVETIQEMLLRYAADTLFLLPAQASRLHHIQAENLHFPGGTVSFTQTDKGITGTITATRHGPITVVTPEKRFTLTMTAGETYTF